MLFNHRNKFQVKDFLIENQKLAIINRTSIHRITYKLHFGTMETILQHLTNCQIKICMMNHLHDYLEFPKLRIFESGIMNEKIENKIENWTVATNEEQDDRKLNKDTVEMNVRNGAQ